MKNMALHWKIMIGMVLGVLWAFSMTLRLSICLRIFETSIESRKSTSSEEKSTQKIIDCKISINKTMIKIPFLWLL